MANLLDVHGERSGSGSLSGSEPVYQPLSQSGGAAGRKPGFFKLALAAIVFNVIAEPGARFRGGSARLRYTLLFAG